MLTTQIIALTLFPAIAFSGYPVSMPHSQMELASHEMPLRDRQPNKGVNDIFRDNILLNLAYMDGAVSSKTQINWDLIRRPVIYQFNLGPGQTFAFHDSVLPEYQGRVTYTSNAHFNFSDGFKSDGYLVGDGVCHFASLINWAARDAGLFAVAPTAHNFANIPDVPKQYGVAIFYHPNQAQTSSLQNLYITNTYQSSVIFKIDYQNDNLKVTILKDS